VFFLWTEITFFHILELNFVIYFFISYCLVLVNCNNIFNSNSFTVDQINIDYGLMELFNDLTLSSVIESYIEFFITSEPNFEFNLYLKLFFNLIEFDQCQLYCKFNNGLLDHDTRLIHPLLNDFLNSYVSSDFVDEFSLE